MHSRAIGLSVILFCAGYAGAQCPVMPAGTVCITQAAANAAAANAREVVALREKDAVQQEALKQKDVTIAELKDVNAKNVQDLTGQLMKVTAEAAHEKGQRVQLEADKVFWTEIIKIAIQNTRKKCAGVSLIC